MNDYSRNKEFSFILPRGHYNSTSNKYESLIMVSIKDSEGGITNITKIVEV